MTFLLPVVAAAVALLILPYWSFSYDVVPKAAVVLVGAAMALVLGGDWRWKASPRLRWLTLAILAQIAASLIAAIFSTHRALSLAGSLWRSSGVVTESAVLLLALGAALHFASDESAMRWFLRITVLAALPVALYGILQYFGVDPWLDPAPYHAGEGVFRIVRPPSTLGHADYFGTYLLYAIFAGVALALTETRAWRAVGLGVSGVSTFALVLSGTRAALLGLMVGAIFAFVRRSKAQPVSWNWLAAGAAILALVAIFYVSPAGGLLRARVHWSSEDQSGGGRPLLWRDTLRMSMERPIAGYGPETFSLEFPRHQSVDLARAYPEFYQESPHNMLLDALVSKGILGLAALLAAIWLGLVSARGAMGGAFVAMLVSQQFSVFTIPTELYFYLCLAAGGTGFSLCAPTNEKPRPSVVRWGLALVLVGFAIRLATGDALLAAARRAIDRGDLTSAAARLDQARAWGASADLNFSRLFLAQAQSQTDPTQKFRAYLYAMQAATRAPESAEDRQNALLNLAAFQASQNDAASVERSLRQAIEAAPNWFKPHWLLAQVLARDGRMGEARKEAAVAVERNGGQNPEVAETQRLLNR